jgi:hypothetical protein
LHWNRRIKHGNRIRVVGIGALVSCVALPVLAQCVCSSQPACQQYRTSAAIFVARLSELVPTVPPGGTVARLFVRQALRGSVPRTIDFRTDGECGARFHELGEEYLVYATRYNGRLVTSICSRTRLLTDATADVQVIQSLNARKREGTVYGYLITSSGGNSFNIILDGAPGHRELVFDGGPYEINGVIPGSYQLTITRNDGELILRRNIRVGVRGCENAGDIESRR